MRILAAGVSPTEVCGVRDHALLLAGALTQEGTEVETVWCEQAAGEPLPAWLERVEARSAAARPDWLLWHYSPFTYGFRGLPTLVPRVAGTLGALGPRLVAFLHELALPFGRNGWRGAAHTLSQRAALVPVLRASDAAVVTVESRLHWLESRRWLPRRPLAFAPVFSNLPVAAGRLTGLDDELSVGIFGFAHSTPNARLVADALAALRAQGLDVRLVLLGSPGPDSLDALLWQRALEAAGEGSALSFTGVVEPPDLAVALASLDAVVFADPAGPSSRKGTLAAALAAGRAVVALSGPEEWPEYAREGALELVPPQAADLAGALARLLREPARREALGAAAAAFARERLTPAAAARTVLDLLARADR